MKQGQTINSAVSSLARAIGLVLLAGAGIGLASCSSLESRTAPVTAQTAPGTTPATTRPAPSSSTLINVPELTSGNVEEQQRLIEEINRDGSRVQVSGYRDQAPQPVNPQGEDVVELNYEQADLRQVLEDLADAIDITVVADPSIDARVTIRTSANRPLSRDDIWPLIRILTRRNGVTLERLGDFYAAYAVTTALPTDIVTPETVSQTPGNRVMQVTPLTYVASDSAIEVLSPMLEEGSIIKLTNRNVLAISGSASQLERVNELLTLIDADPFANQGIQLFQLRNASAEEVATELVEILTQIEGQAPTYQVKGISRINAILVTAPATRGFEEINRWIRILDSENQEQVEQLFYYKVKNLSAVELAETLTNVFEEDDDEFVPRAANEVREPVLETADVSPDTAAFTVASPTAVSANLRVRIVADEATNSLLIRSTARDYRQLLTTINQLDAVPLQVVVNAVIAQITLTDQNRFGVDWSRVASSAADPISTSTSTSFLPEPETAGRGGLGGLLFNKTFVDGSAQVDATLEAIAANNEVRLLARPTLTVTNNQEGQIQIGSDVPVQAGQSIGTGGFATTNIQYRETGIVLTLTPQINADGVVNLTIEQELSSVASSDGVNQNPIFNSQNISTSVVVRDGDSVVLGGLIQNDNQNLNTGVPGLNRVPVLGGLFSYRQDLNERKELFIVLRPEVVDLNDRNTVGYSEILERFELAAELFEEEGI
ncbi:MAG: type II secretion system secretin GspD [Gammaproteobacteria bacterium]|nr:type II secretion system secretin GspD [Pseudomonadales bacterium]